MASTLETNKIVAAVLTAGVIAMSTGFIAEILFHKEPLEEDAYKVATGDGPDGEPAPEEESVEPIAPLMASADPSAGEDVTRKCAACHTFEKGGPNKVGPNIWGVLGSEIASQEGFSYSDALSGKSGETWTYENLNHFLADPKGWAPGTKMAFGGIGKAEERADLIAYMRSLSDSPEPLPEPEPAEPEGGGEAAADEGGEAPAGEGSEEAQPGSEGEETGGDESQGGDSGEAQAGSSGVATQVAAADPAVGEKATRKCAACHSFEQGGPRKVGPNLWDIVGSKIAGVEGFNYSDALKGKSGETWTYENLDAYLQNPKDWAPGTKMTFAGIKKDEERHALIAYLRSLSEDPEPLPQESGSGGSNDGDSGGSDRASIE